MFLPNQLCDNGSQRQWLPALTLEMWGPILDRARERGELRAGLDNEQACEWLALVQLILVGRLDFEDPADPAHRQLLETFVLPAFLPAAS